jgi:hypothetical protein
LDGAADGVRLNRHLPIGFHPFAHGLVADGVGKFRLDHAWIDAGTSNLVALLPKAFRDRSHRELGGRLDGGGRLNNEPSWSLFTLASIYPPAILRQLPPLWTRPGRRVTCVSVPAPILQFLHRLTPTRREDIVAAPRRPRHRRFRAMPPSSGNICGTLHRRA